MDKDFTCSWCQGTEYLDIPDSIAYACKSCGKVYICGEAVPAGSLSLWAKELYEKGESDGKHESV